MTHSPGAYPNIKRAVAQALKLDSDGDLAAAFDAYAAVLRDVSWTFAAAKAIVLRTPVEQRGLYYHAARVLAVRERQALLQLLVLQRASSCCWDRSRASPMLTHARPSPIVA